MENNGLFIGNTNTEHTSGRVVSSVMRGRSNRRPTYDSLNTLLETLHGGEGDVTITYDFGFAPVLETLEPVAGHFFVGHG